MSGLKSTNIAATTAAVNNRFVTTANMSLTPYTLANTTPVWAGGCLVTIAHTTVAGADTLGTITIVGVDLHGEPLTETITPLAGTTATGTKVFRSLTSATSVGWVATSTADTIIIGCAAGSYAAIGGGILHAATVNNVVATAFTISDASGTIATVGASAAIGQIVYDVPWSGFLKIATTSTNDVTLIHSPGVPNTYAMA